MHTAIAYAGSRVLRGRIRVQCVEERTVQSAFPLILRGAVIHPSDMAFGCLISAFEVTFRTRGHRGVSFT